MTITIPNLVYKPHYYTVYNGALQEVKVLGGKFFLNDGSMRLHLKCLAEDVDIWQKSQEVFASQHDFEYNIPAHTTPLNIDIKSFLHVSDIIKAEDGVYVASYFTYCCGNAVEKTSKLIYLDFEGPSSFNIVGSNIVETGGGGIYKSAEDVFFDYDYKIKDNEGVRTIKSPKTLLTYTEEQLALIEKFNTLAKEMKDNDLSIIYSTCNSNAYFFNQKNVGYIIDNADMNYDDRKEVTPDKFAFKKAEVDVDDIDFHDSSLYVRSKTEPEKSQEK